MKAVPKNLYIFSPIITVLFSVSFLFILLFANTAHAGTDEECDTCFNANNAQGKITNSGADVDVWNCMGDWGTLGPTGHRGECAQDCERDLGCTADQRNNWIEYVKHWSCGICKDECASIPEPVYGNAQGNNDEEKKDRCVHYYCSSNNDDESQASGLNKKDFNGPCGWNTEPSAWLDNPPPLSKCTEPLLTTNPNDEKCILNKNTTSCYTKANKCNGHDNGKRWDMDCANYLRSPEFESCLKTLWDERAAKCKTGQEPECTALITQINQTIQSRFNFTAIGTIDYNAIPGGFGCNLVPDPAGTGKMICERKALNVPSFVADVWSVGSILFGGLAIIKIVFGGIMYATAAGNSQRITSAKEHILYAFIGLIVIILANIILNVLGAGEKFF